MRPVTVSEYHKFLYFQCRGHYHISVPESGVGEFYRSYSGYNDELMWGAMWLFKTTGNRQYLDDAIQQVNYVSNAEFSWDQKGPGALASICFSGSHQFFSNRRFHTYASMACITLVLNTATLGIRRPCTHSSAPALFKYTLGSIELIYRH